MHRYYLTQRPPCIGTHPDGAVRVEAFDHRDMTEYGFRAWGWVEYSDPLTPEQVNSYELRPCDA